MTSMLCGLVCVVLLSGLTALARGQQSPGESVKDITLCVIKLQQIISMAT